MKLNIFISVKMYFLEIPKHNIHTCKNVFLKLPKPQSMLNLNVYTCFLRFLKICMSKVISL